MTDHLIVGIFRALTVKGTALFLLWGICMLIASQLSRWYMCLPFYCNKMHAVITIVIGSLAAVIGLATLLPLPVFIALSKVTIPCMSAAVAVHLLLLSFDEFMQIRDHAPLAYPQKLVAVIIIYVIAFIMMLLALHIQSDFFLDIFDTVSSYVIYGCIYATLALQILSRREFREVERD